MWSSGNVVIFGGGSGSLPIRDPAETCTSGAMSRLPDIDSGEFTDQQQQLHESLMSRPEVAHMGVVNVGGIVVQSGAGIES